MSRDTVGAVCAVLLAAVFLLAAVTKLASPASWRAQAAAMRVPAAVAAVVPFVEAALGALLLVQWQRHLVAWMAAAVLASFTVLLALRLAQGERPACACFGSWSATPISPATLLRNVAFIALAVAAALL